MLWFDIRWEIGPECLILHPIIHKLTRDTVPDFITVATPLTLWLMDKYNYDYVYFASNNWKLFRVFRNIDLEYVTMIPEGLVYRLSKEKILCLKQLQ